MLPPTRFSRSRSLSTNEKAAVVAQLISAASLAGREPIYMSD